LWQCMDYSPREPRHVGQRSARAPSGRPPAVGLSSSSRRKIETTSATSKSATGPSQARGRRGLSADWARDCLSRSGRARAAERERAAQSPELVQRPGPRLQAFQAPENRFSK
jgi:hypothetical protein